MSEADKPKTLLTHRLLATFVVLFAVGAIARGFLLDAQLQITQPQLFWSFLILGLGGSLLGWRIGMRHDRKPSRNLIALFGTLLAWRLSYFPLMVLSGWKASISDWICWSLFSVNIVYPVFLLVLFSFNLLIGLVAAAAVAVPQTDAPQTGRLLFLRRLAHSPPRKLLWVLGVIALPVAFLTSFSWSEDYVLFGDSPWQDAREVPPIADPKANPYDEILKTHADELGPGSWVLAKNAAMTYPLVPEGPWGKAMKGTLEQLTRQHPLASSRGRVDEHYLAYLAAHKRLHEAGQ